MSYGCLGQVTALIYNPNVATSITTQGRACVSSMTLHFEMFLADNVKFGSLDQLVEFINNICNERHTRKFNDFEILNHIPTKEECFAKLILECGYRWVPNDEELDIIWKIVNNLNGEDITRIYYKNNLYEFVENIKISNLVTGMLEKLYKPYFTSVKVPPEIADDLNTFKELCMEYVYYQYMFIDRIDRCDNMIKSVTMVSDTDSTIISLDAWYRFIANKVSGKELRIANYCADPITFSDKDEDDGTWLSKPWEEPFEFLPKKYDYNFYTDEISYSYKVSNPDQLTPNDNVRYSIISILGYVLDRTVNDYMIKMCINQNSVKEPYHLEKDCKIFAKNEFLFKRLMMVPHAKKNYASLIEVQEGNIVPKDAQLDIKGIEAIHKSSKPLSTRKALKKILLEDILDTPIVDQLQFIKDIAILEKNIRDALYSGSREYYKPVTVKSISAYDDPMKIQGIKASIAWNMIRPSDVEAININERNAIDIIKVNINRGTVEDIKDTYPDIYQNMINALDDNTFKTFVKDPKTGEKTKLSSNEITAIALPLEVQLPEWIRPFIDYDSIVADNLGGFPYESIGIQRLFRNINYTNIVKL